MFRADPLRVNFRREKRKEKGERSLGRGGRGRRRKKNRNKTSRDCNFALILPPSHFPLAETHGLDQTRLTISEREGEKEWRYLGRGRGRRREKSPLPPTATSSTSHFFSAVLSCLSFAERKLSLGTPFRVVFSSFFLFVETLVSSLSAPMPLPAAAAAGRAARTGCLPSSTSSLLAPATIRSSSPRSSFDGTSSSTRVAAAAPSSSRLQQQGATRAVAAKAVADAPAAPSSSSKNAATPTLLSSLPIPNKDDPSRAPRVLIAGGGIGGKFFALEVANVPESPRRRLDQCGRARESARDERELESERERGSYERASI